MSEATAPVDAQATTHEAPPSRRWLWLAIALHFLLGGMYLVILPLWGAVPDEPLHYSCIKYDAEFMEQPLITDPRPWGEPLAVYCFTADPSGVAQQGPLHYWASVPLYLLTRDLTIEQQFYVLRVFVLCYSAFMIPLAWLILLRLLPSDPKLVILGTLLVTIWPHRLMLSAVIYNDAATATTCTFYLWLLLRAGSDAPDERAPRDWLIAGLGLGLAFLAKRVALVLIPGSVLVLLLMGHRRNWSLLRVVLVGGAWGLGFLLGGGWWILRDLSMYGTPFPTEPGHEAIHFSWLEQWFGLPRETFWWKIRMIFRGFWLSLWSLVGWLPFEEGHPPAWRAFSRAIYALLGVYTLVGVVGFFGGLKSRWRGLKRWKRDMLIGYAGMFAGMIYGALHWVMLYSFHNHEETGKHGQVILVCVVALSIAAWRWAIGPRRAVGALAGALVLMVIFNVGSVLWLKTHLIPTWAPETPALGRERVRDLPSGVAPGIWHRYRVPGVEQRGGYVPKPPMPEGLH